MEEQESVQPPEIEWYYKVDAYKFLTDITASEKEGAIFILTNTEGERKYLNEDAVTMYVGLLNAFRQGKKSAIFNQ